MPEFLYEIDRMTRREQRNFILSVGGSIGFLKGILQGGTGLGGLILNPSKNNWWEFREFGQVSASLERMKKVLMLRLNDTRRTLAIPIEYRVIESIKISQHLAGESKRMELEIVICWEGGPDLLLENRGWNNRTILKYFTADPLGEVVEWGPGLEL